MERTRLSLFVELEENGELPFSMDALEIGSLDYFKKNKESVKKVIQEQINYLKKEKESRQKNQKNFKTNYSLKVFFSIDTMDEEEEFLYNDFLIDFVVDNEFNIDNLDEQYNKILKEIEETI